MASTDPWTGARLGDMSDAPLGGQYDARIVTDLRTLTRPRFATQAARDAAVTALTAAGVTLPDGAECYTEDAGPWMLHNNIWVGAYGLRAYGTTPSSWTTTANPGPTRIANGLTVTTYMKKGRAYQYRAKFRAWSTSAADTVQAVARITRGGDTPDVTDPAVGEDSTTIEQAGAANLYRLRFDDTFQVGTSGTYTVAPWVFHSSGSGVITVYPMPSGSMYAELHAVGVALTNVRSVF